MEIETGEGCTSSMKKPKALTHLDAIVKKPKKNPYMGL
jgi:hypothetical protein